MGLGNPGKEYLYTRHNVGFMALDYYLNDLNELTHQELFGYLFTSLNLNDEEIVFIKPYTFMNNSGKPISKALEEFGVSHQNILIIHDDIGIPLGVAEYNVGGSHGGHNGYKSVVLNLGTTNLKRIQIGIGRPPEGTSTVDFVLGEVTEDEQSHIEGALSQASALIREKFLKGK